MLASVLLVRDATVSLLHSAADGGSWQPLVTIGLLTKNSELVVMKACGISLYRVALPIVGAAIVAGGTLFLLGETVLGPSNRRAEAIRHVIRGGSPADV